MFLISYTLGK